MYIAVTHRLNVRAGEKPGTLVLVPSFIDVAGNQVAVFDQVQLSEGVEIDVGPVSVEVNLTCKTAVAQYPDSDGGKATSAPITPATKPIGGLAKR
jgi:hypothetical protein